MGNNCSSCCNRGGRRSRKGRNGERTAAAGRHKEKPLTEPSPVFPTDRRNSSGSGAASKRGSFDVEVRQGLLLPGGGGGSCGGGCGVGEGGGGGGSPYTTSTTAATSATATPRGGGGGGGGGGNGRGEGGAEKRLSLSGSASGVGATVGVVGAVGGGGGAGGGVSATLSLDPLAGVATVMRNGGESHGGKRSFVSRIPPLGRSGSGEFR